MAARKLALDPADIRRRNYIRPEQFPYTIPSGNEYDSGNYEAVLDKVLKLADYAALRKEQAAVRKAAVRLASDAERFREWAEEFFGAHGEYVADQLAIPRAAADRYAAERCRELERAGVRAFEGADEAIEELAALALSCAEEG